MNVKWKEATEKIPLEMTDHDQTLSAASGPIPRTAGLTSSHKWTRRASAPLSNLDTRPLRSQAPAESGCHPIETFLNLLVKKFKVILTSKIITFKSMAQLKKASTQIKIAPH